MQRRLLVLTSLLFCHAAWTIPQVGSNDITADRLKVHVTYLASDELEGRLAGSEGNRKAAEYIADQFTHYGLKPAGDSATYFQTFDFVSAVKLGTANQLAFEGSNVSERVKGLNVDEDFRPLGFSIDASVSAPLAFAGYGIAAPDKNYDDYANTNVDGKIVVVLRYSPEGNDPQGELNRYSSLREKARIARDRGAKGLIIVTGPLDEQDDDLIKLTYDHSLASSGIAAVSVKRAVIEALLDGLHTNLTAIQDSIKITKKPVTFDFPQLTANLTTDVVKVKSQTANIVGYLEGNDPAVKSQVLVVGAHMDHIGYGGPGSGSLTPDAHEIHNGADDNASGTAGLLELAHVFAARKQGLKRTIVFISFSAEEIGALGSTYYVNHPFFPLEQSIAMINMDMIGRLHGKTLSVGGTGTSAGWTGLLAKYNRDSTFTLNLDASGFGPSDHARFTGKDIPVLFFWTGEHGDYHKPTDDWDKINYEGEERIVRYVYDIAKEVEEQPERPVFVKVQTPASSTGDGDTRGFPVTLGIMLDYGQGSEGIKIIGIRPGRPAEKAGLKSGDVIVKMAGKKVMNIYEYMGILGQLKAGEVIELEVMRQGKPLTVSATMQRK